MAISDDLNSIRTHLEDDYTALETLGVSVEDRNIENIKDMANQIYAKFPKTDYAEGSNITLENTLKGKLDFEDGIVGIGDTKQAIIPSEYQQVEYIEGSGTQYITTNYKLGNNTAEIKTKVYIPNMLDAENDIVGNQDLTTNRFVLGIFNKKVFGYSRSADTQDDNVITSAYSGSQTLEIDLNYNANNHTKTLNVNGTISSNTYNASISSTTTNTQVFANGGDTNCFIGKIYYLKIYENNVLKLNLIPCYKISNNTIGMYDLVSNTFYTNAGTGTFTKGANAPTPSTPIDIEVVRGKNRFNKDVEKKSAYPSQTIGNVVTYGTSSATYSYVNCCEIEKGTTYTISWKQDTTPASTSGRIGVIVDNNNIVLATQETWVNSVTYKTFTATVSGKLILATDVNTSNIQIEKGSQVTSYLPYNTLEVVERGINNAEVNDFTGANTPIGNVKKGKTYTFWAELDSGVSADYNLRKNTVDGTVVKTQYNQTNYVKETFTADDDFLLFFNGFNSYNLKNIMLVEGTYTLAELLPFEPYQTPQTYQLSLGEYEFAKGNDNADEIIYDIENDKVYKNEKMNKKVLNGTEEWLGNIAWDNQYLEIFHCYTTAFNDWLVGQTQYFCDKFICTTDVDRDFTKELMTCHRTSRALYIFILISRLNGITINSTLEEKIIALKTWLSENKPEVWYQLNTPVKKEITGTLKDQIKALYNSHSFTGTTIIEIDGQLPLIIKVRALKG